MISLLLQNTSRVTEAQKLNCSVTRNRRNRQQWIKFEYVCGTLKCCDPVFLVFVPTAFYVIVQRVIVYVSFKYSYIFLRLIFIAITMVHIEYKSTERAEIWFQTKNSLLPKVVHYVFGFSDVCSIIRTIYSESSLCQK